MADDKEKRVLLAYPPSRSCLREDRCQVPAGNLLMSPLLPPTDLLYLAAVAERLGWACRVEDYSTSPNSTAAVLAELKEFNPRYLVVAVTTPTLTEDLEFCVAAKKALPDAQIIAKGAHALLFDRQMLDQCPELDMVLRGEPEITFQKILTGESLSNILGLTWRGADGVCQNPERPYHEPLDDLPFPARHLIDNSRYVRPDTGKPQAVIKVARGCPYHCFYCLATPVSGKKVRRRSPENILAEIRECVENYGIRDFLFWSDVFNTDRAWVISLCDAVRKSGLDIRWAANSRAEAIDRDTACAMRAAGCTLVSVGVESGSQEMLDRMGKGIQIEQIRKAFSVLKEAGITTLAYYLFGLPWETKQTAEETISFSLELDSDYANFFVSAPLPGTRFYDYALQQKLFEEGDGDVFTGFRDAYFSPVIRSHFLGKAEIAKLRRQAVKRFILRPRYILNNLRKIRSWNDLLRYGTVAFSLMRVNNRD
jgi:radical SAM superfamily enzyme YgiQ (UPF0313 family)